MAKGMGNLMKQAQQMQARMAKMQEEVGKRTVEASAGGGMVTVVANGKQEILSIVMEPEAVDPDDIEMLQDLVLAATNQALRESQAMMTDEMSKLTGGLKIPGLS
ncbi:MAG: YbaB/EbfC family nucleoid-associated protein [Deltaproteobacteria bacterium]|nr:YbaB/EbfC family nucleoid-associated protein [Candidatus Tharpella sp.]